jgi:hypothetical protein
MNLIVIDESASIYNLNQFSACSVFSSWKKKGDDVDQQTE